MSPEELPPDVHTVDLWIDGRFARRMSREVFEEERAVAELVMPFLHDGLKFFEQNDVPPAALRGPSSSVPPDRSTSEEERIVREFVPLVRAAAEAAPIGEVPKLDPEFARVKALTSRSLLDYSSSREAQEAQRAINELIAEAIRNLPPHQVARAFVTRHQLDLLRQHAAPPQLPRPEALGVIAPLAGVPLVVLPERTRWQRFREWLRRWRWWR